MYPNQPPRISLPTDLSDQAAANLLDFLHDLVRALENHYAPQLYRYHHPRDDRQPDLWDQLDPPR